jgi:hypothetical protein
MNSNTLAALLVLFGVGSIVWAIVDIASVGVNGLECSARLVEHVDAH